MKKKLWTVRMKSILTNSRSSKKAPLNAMTCIQPVNGPELKMANVLNIAPAEGQTPTTYFKQP